MQQRNFFKSLWDECRKISEPTIGDSDKLKWVTNWCQFLFQETRKWSAVSHYWKHSKSFNWRNIWKWLWAPSRHSLSLCIFSSTVMSCVCDSVTEAEPWQLNPATKSLSLATSLPICRCRGSQQSYFLLLFCAKLFYVRSGLQVITSFLVSKHVLYIILLSSLTLNCTLEHILQFIDIHKHFHHRMLRRDQ